MGTTSYYAIRYPELTDSPDGATEIKNTATDVDGALHTVHNEIGTATTPGSWVNISLSNGWTLGTGGRAKVRKKTASNEAQFSGHNLTPPGGSGNDEGTIIGTVTSAYQPANAHDFPVACDYLRLNAGVNNNIGAWFTINSAGQIMCHGIGASATMVHFEAHVPLDL